MCRYLFCVGSGSEQGSALFCWYSRFFGVTRSEIQKYVEVKQKQTWSASTPVHMCSILSGHSKKWYFMQSRMFWVYNVKVFHFFLENNVSIWKNILEVAQEVVGILVRLSVLGHTIRNHMSLFRGTVLETHKDFFWFFSIFEKIDIWRYFPPNMKSLAPREPKCRAKTFVRYPTQFYKKTTAPPTSQNIQTSLDPAGW